jgi:Methyltransferase domain
MSPGRSVLVVIASFGTSNDGYLKRIVAEYRSMPFDLKIVVLSNMRKDVCSDVELVVVDLRGKDPWSLPFAHKEILARHANEYDFFVYSEDDILVTERNLRALQEVSAALPPNEVPGFIRFEEGPGGDRHFPDVHGHFHWEPQSIRNRGGQTFAFFTNEHSACYVLTRSQLKLAINSGGFLVGAHADGKYLLPETASTDPFTQCHLAKLICISRSEDFLVHHLPNKYMAIGLGIGSREFQRQVNALLRLDTSECRVTSLFPTETKLRHAYYSKSYYEPVREDLASAIPENARSVLSIGAGSGEMEAWLAAKGTRVVALPLDPIILADAGERGIEVIGGDFQCAREKLTGESFDCLLLSNVLHLVSDPVDVLASFASLLVAGGVAVVLVPHVLRLMLYWRRMRGGARRHSDTGYNNTGAHVTSQRVLRGWFRKAGMKMEYVKAVSQGTPSGGAGALGRADVLGSSDIIAVARTV